MDALTSPYPTRSVFLLAGHPSPEWEALYSVFGAVVERETLVERLTRQIQAAGSEPYVVTSDVHLINQANLFIRLNQPKSILQECLRTHPSWRNRVIFLRADVYYTEWAVNAILGADARPHAFGNNIHTWAFSFSRPYHEDVYAALVDACEETSPQDELTRLSHILRGRIANYDVEYTAILDTSFLATSIPQYMECLGEIKMEENMRKSRGRR